MAEVYCLYITIHTSEAMGVELYDIKALYRVHVRWSGQYGRAAVAKIPLVINRTGGIVGEVNRIAMTTPVYQVVKAR